MATEKGVLVVERVPACADCLYYLGSGTCEAFPNKIPQDIQDGLDHHTESRDGDHGIQFEQIKGSNLRTPLPTEDELAELEAMAASPNEPHDAEAAREGCPTIRRRGGSPG